MTIIIQIHSFPLLYGSREPEFRSIIIKDSKESFPIGSKQFIKWKSSLPPSTEAVIEILSSPRYEFTPPEIIWKTTAVSQWSYYNIYYARIYTQNHPRVSGTSDHFTIYSLPI
ncbi:21167_t:CDS:2 [Rhizophagus irregularis]|nr:21167_t:CDS:2 [Rhizophagus irregularis]